MSAVRVCAFLICSWALTIVVACLITNLLSCAAFERVAPPIPCPKRCATGGCCGFAEECRSFGCAFVGDLYAARKDAGAT